MYSFSAYSKKNPIEVSLKDKDKNHVKWFPIGKGKATQKELRYAHSIGLVKWVDKVDKKEE